MPAHRGLGKRADSMRSLLWLRHDLRVNDNPALMAALQAGGEGVVALFVMTPSQWKRHGWGNPRVSFLLHALRSLGEELNRLRIPLLIRQVQWFSEVSGTILQVARDHQCTIVCAGREFGIDEVRRDRAVGQRLASHDIGFQLHADQTLLPVEEIRTRQGKSYSVFTPFKKRWEALFQERGLPEAAVPAACRQLLTTSDKIPQVADGFERSAVIEFWDASPPAVQGRLDDFLSGAAKHYHLQRDRPDLQGTSSLSPWLAVGAIAPQTCLRPLVDRYGMSLDRWPDGPRTWQVELVWREFYRYVMHWQPRLSMGRPMQAWTDQVAWRDDDRGFQAWCAGCTGIPLVDAGMRQLAATGWMHNRLRMVTAMFLTKNLLIDWRRGERFFAQSLVDYDFPSNNGGWQWAASTGADAAPYFRVFSPLLQAKRFDPEGDFVRVWNAGNSNPAAIDPIVELQSTRRRAILAFKEARVAFGP